MNGANLRKGVSLNQSVAVISAPPAEPVSLADAKLWCKVDYTDDDTIIAMIVQAARERAEDITGHAFVQRQLEMRLDSFPDENIIELPFPPLQSVDYIKYIDGDGALQTLTGSPSLWIEDAASRPARIQTLDGGSWPATKTQIAAVRIGFTCGYAPSVGSPTDYGANVPNLVKQWMQLRIATFYDNRGSLFSGTRLEQPPRDYVDGLLDGLKVNLGFA